MQLLHSAPLTDSWSLVATFPVLLCYSWSIPSEATSEQFVVLQWWQPATPTMACRYVNVLVPAETVPLQLEDSWETKTARKMLVIFDVYMQLMETCQINNIKLSNQRHQNIHISIITLGNTLTVLSDKYFTNPNDWSCSIKYHWTHCPLLCNLSHKVAKEVLCRIYRTWISIHTCKGMIHQQIWYTQGSAGYT